MVIRIASFLLALVPVFAAQPASVDSGNVSHLKIAWTYRTGEPLTPVEGGGRAPAFEATAVYAHNLLYISTPFGSVSVLRRFALS